MDKLLYDRDIREPLFDFLELKYGKLRILEEKNIGISRADVVMVLDGAVCGIEIKSDADTYARLSRQVKDYDRFFDYNYIVVGSTHAGSVESHVPEHWGIVTVELIEDKIDFYLLKEPLPNPNLVLMDKLRMMWRPELVEIQAHFLMPAYKASSKEFVIGKIAERTTLEENHKNYIDIKDLNMVISDILFERDYNLIADKIKEYRQLQHPEKKVRRKRKRYRRKSV